MDRSKSDETLGFSLCLERTNAGQTFKQVSQLCLVKMVFSLCPKITYSAPVKIIHSKQCYETFFRENNIPLNASCGTSSSDFELSSKAITGSINCL